MKKRSSIAWAFWTCFSMGLVTQSLAQSVSPQPVKAISAADFENAFQKAVLASRNNYHDIVSSGTVEIFSRPHKKVTIAFPGAIKAGYNYQELPDLYFGETICVHKLTVLYFEGDNFSEAVSLYDKVKNLLDQCRRKNIGGTWKMGDGKYLGLTRHGRTFNFERNVEDEKALRISLVLDYEGYGKARVRMNLDIDYYE